MEHSAAVICPKHVIAAFVVLAYGGSSGVSGRAAQSPGSNPPQSPSTQERVFETPSDLARALATQAVQVPPNGKVKQSIDKGAPRFDTPLGWTTALLLRLPEYQAPYLLTITSFRRGLGRTTEVFIPVGAFLDQDVQPLRLFGEDKLQSREQSLAVEWLMGEAMRRWRYVLLFTRPDLVGRRVGVQAVIDGTPISGKLGTWLGSGFGFDRVERSLEARMQIETAPRKESAIVKKLGGPWKQIEGSNEERIRELLGPPSSSQYTSRIVTWYYDNTAAGTVAVYVVNGVATLSPPK